MTSINIAGQNILGREMRQLDGRIKELTEEQAYNRDVILNLSPRLGPTNLRHNQQHHIIIQAAAGTGKTTSSLAIPYFASQDRFMLLTFNNELCGNTKQRVQYDWGLDKNTDVYTFHGFMNLFFGTCRNDIDLYNLLSQPNLEPKKKMPRWARICLDEFQDANYGIYAITQLILFWQNKLYPPGKTGLPATQLIIMGDILQCLYEYSGADRRFITLSNLIYNNPDSMPRGTQRFPPKFTKLALTQTFRCTKPMVDFINKVMLGYPKMFSDKPGIKPQIHVVNIFEITVKHPLVQLVLGLYKKAKGDYGKIAIISHHVRNNQTITKLANILTGKGVPIYISANETDTKNEKRLSKGKLVITSVHKSKGREWPYVVVLGFDDYFEKRDSESTDEKQHKAERKNRVSTCTDVAYVAVSRAETELHLIQHYTNGLPGYINLVELPKYADIQEHSKRPTNTPQLQNNKPIIYKASDISRHMDTSVIRQAIQKLDLQNINSPCTEEKIITAPNEYIAPDGTVEDTSAINGVSVPVWYECHYRKKAPEILEMIKRMLGSDNGRLFAKYYNPEWQRKALKPHEYTVRDVLQMSNLYIGLRDEYLYLCRQMESASWDWITVDQLNESARRINEVIQSLTPEVAGNQKLEFEKLASNPNMHISGSIDLYTPMTVFEFKFKSALSTEDILQTAISMFLGYEIGTAELFNAVNNMTAPRLESLIHIKPGHTILAQQPKTYKHVVLQVLSKTDDNILICSAKKNSSATVSINLDEVLADLTWLKQTGFIHDKQGILFNIKTGEVIQITAKRTQLEEMLGIILKEKELMNSGKNKKPTDTEFLQICLEIQAGIWSGSGIDLGEVIGGSK